MNAFQAIQINVNIDQLEVRKADLPPPGLLILTNIRSLLGVVYSFFSQYFIHTACFLARGLTSGWNGQYADGSYRVVATNTDLISHFHRVRRFRCTSIDRDAARITEFLCQRASTTKAACFKKEIETHQKEGAGGRGRGRCSKSATCFLLLPPAPVSYGFGKIPSSLPFFFFSPGCSPPLGIPFSAVFSGVIFRIGYTAAA